MYIHQLSTVEVFEKASNPKDAKLLDDYKDNHGVPRSIQLDQTRCLNANKVENFCKYFSFNITTAPANDHSAIDLVERFIQTVKED